MVEAHVIIWVAHLAPAVHAIPCTSARSELGAAGASGATGISGGVRVNSTGDPGN